MGKITDIVLIEDNKTFRDALTLLISTSHGFTVVNTYSNCEEAIENLKEDNPSLVIMDINLPAMSGVEGIRVIKKLVPSINILVITGIGDKEIVFEAFSSGATGFITKDADYMDIMIAIREVSEGGAPMSKSISRLVVESFHNNYESPLTDRETEVLQLLSKGKTYKEIGEKLFIHAETVKSHLKNIYVKLNVHNKADAIMKAVNERLLKYEY